MWSIESQHCITQSQIVGTDPQVTELVGAFCSIQVGNIFCQLSSEADQLAKFRASMLTLSFEAWSIVADGQRLEWDGISLHNNFRNACFIVGSPNVLCYI